MRANTHVLRLDLPGRWADGWLYKEYLILWSRAGEMHVVPLSELVDEVRKVPSAALRVVAEHLIFRNDWKSAGSFGQMMSVPGVEDNFLADFRGTSGEIIMMLDGIPLEPAGTDHVPGVVLDASIYAGNIYAASTNGLYETRFDPDNPADRQPLVARFEKRVGAVSARYSVINGSAGESGLLFSHVDFDEGEWWRGKQNFKRIAEVSRDHSFASYNLLNYTDDALPSFMRAERVKDSSKKNTTAEEVRISGYDAPSDIRNAVARALGGRKHPEYNQPTLDMRLDDEPIEVLGNSGSRLLVAEGGSLNVMDISLRRERDLEVKRDPSYRRIRELEIDAFDVLDTHAFGDGFLVELSDEVRLINTTGSHSLISEPVARIRTFPNSRRYKEVILLVRESGVSLLGVYVATASS